MAEPTENKILASLAAQLERYRAADVATGGKKETRLNRSSRFALVTLFGSCGIWLLAYCLPLLDNSRTPMPQAFSWAWSLSVAIVFRKLAPAVWIGMYATILSGTHLQVFWDCLAASFYLLVSLTLLLREELGVRLASFACFLNTVFLALYALDTWINSVAPRGTVGFVSLALLMAALAGYAILARVLGKMWTD